VTIGQKKQIFTFSIQAEFGIVFQKVEVQDNKKFRAPKRPAGVT
jgi:hypothetical protein